MRPSWDGYFMKMAAVAATRATCDRKHVGAIIVNHLDIIATGYNGSAPGMPHCDDVGHLIIDNHCARTIHAEVNAIVRAARNGVQTKGCVMYVTAYPCWGCFKAIAAAGISKVLYHEAYRPDPLVRAAAEAIGIELVQFVE